jgi:3-oxoacyl-[acyl-carrier-protein] synthase III
MRYSKIVGTGSYLPEKVMTNRELEKLVDTSDEWIVIRTGIKQRHIAAEDEKASDLALQASLRALEAAEVSAQDIDLIVLATTTPDQIFPSTACALQAKLGIRNCPAFDVQAVCSGFVYALGCADAMVRSGSYRNALVVGAEIYSRILDWSDRGTCILFGDGAGAAVLTASDAAGIFSIHLHADGAYRDMLAVPGGVSKGEVCGRPYLVMDGQVVFKFAVNALEEAAREALAANKMQPSDVSWLIPHQANIRIIDALAKKLGIGMDRVVATVDRHGNTSAASVPLALDLAVRDGRIKSGDIVLLEGVGGGFTWGSALLRW